MNPPIQGSTLPRAPPPHLTPRSWGRLSCVWGGMGRWAGTGPDRIVTGVNCCLVFHAYVDETGDRGSNVASSRRFAMCGLVVPPSSEEPLKQAIATVKTRFGIPLTSPLHWNHHCAPCKKDSFDRRMFVATTLATVPGVMLNYVLFEKASIPGNAAIGNDRQKFYNYVAGITLERIVMSSQYSGETDRRIQVRFGHVRGFDHSSTIEYFNIKRSMPSSVDYTLVVDEPRFIPADKTSGIQAADAYLGILNAAMDQNKYGQYQHQHLAVVQHQIRRGSNGHSWGIGMKVMGAPNFRQRYPWWSTCNLD